MPNLRYALLASACLAGVSMVQPAQALVIDAYIAPDFSFCNSASSFTYDIASRPREMRWRCTSPAPATDKACYITSAATYFDDSKMLVLSCTKDISQAPLPTPDTDLLNDSFEGGVLAAKAREAFMSVPVKIDLGKRMCLPAGENGAMIVDVSALPADRQKEAARNPEYLARLEAVCLTALEEAELADESDSVGVQPVSDSLSTRKIQP